MTVIWMFHIFRVRHSSVVTAVLSLPLTSACTRLSRWSVRVERWEETVDKHLVGNQQPPSEQGRAATTSMKLLKSGGENATAGLSSQIKGRSAPFSFCFDKKIADCSQFICLCPLLVPEAVKLWLKSSRWWDRIASWPQRFVRKRRRRRRTFLAWAFVQRWILPACKLRAKVVFL